MGEKSTFQEQHNICEHQESGGESKQCNRMNHFCIQDYTEPLYHGWRQGISISAPYEHGQWAPKNFHQ